MSRARVFVLGLAMLTAATFAAHATVMQRMDVETLARAAQVVAVARVEAVEARWEPDRMMIRTHATLAVESLIAGEAPSRLDVSVLGGTIDGTTVVYAAGATFVPGDRVAVFLDRRKTRSNEWLVTGAFQGAFRIEREPETGLDLAVRESTREEVSFLGDVDALEPESLYVDELVARVRAARATGGGVR